MSNILIFPTDTVYGIGCPIFDIEGINKIYEIKHRSKEKPLACLCANLNQIEDIALVNHTARKLINSFMPGALTLILPAKENVTKVIGYKTIGVRIPDSSIARDILNTYGPMLTTSVNESGSIPLNDYDEIIRSYEKFVKKIYPPQGITSNISSTVIDLCQKEIQLLREGTLTLEEILKKIV